MSYQQAQRITAILRHLRQHEEAIAEDVAGLFGVSTRTIHRDMALLRRQGVPVEAAGLICILSKLREAIPASMVDLFDEEVAR
mgnify:CR=1 FL=1